MKFATLLTPSSVYNIFKDSTIGPMIPKEMKYNLHYGKVRGDVLPPPHGTNTSCSVVSHLLFLLANMTYELRASDNAFCRGTHMFRCNVIQNRLYKHGKYVKGVM